MADNDEKLVPIPGTERQVLPGARTVGDADPNEHIQVTIYVRPKPTPVPPAALQQATDLPPQMRSYATPEQMKELFGADEADMEKVRRWATDCGLKIDEEDSGKRSIKVSGTTADISKAFGVSLKIQDHPTGRYRGRTGAVCIPSDLAPIVEAVFGLDNRKIGRPYLRKRPPISSLAVTQRPFVAPQLAQIYNFPQQFDGADQCIGILVFNGQVGETGQSAPGGFDREAVKFYFDSLNIPTPTITEVVIHGPGNQPGDGTGLDVTGEVLLDIAVAGALAPGAKIVMYFTEFTEQGWVDAVVTAVTDTENRPSVLSISYGNPEDADGESLWTAAAIRKVNEAFRQAALGGVTICCASGDDGSRDQVQDGLAHVDFPASSPWVLGCGGTRVEIKNGSIRETVWNNGLGSAEGGGVSNLFPLPDYQSSVTNIRSVNPGHRIGRVVPDVCGLADPQTGLLIVGPSGQFEGPIGGTSATAPMWAALIARINQALGKPVGFLNSILYRFLSGGVLRDIVTGNNGSYSAGPGFDACTGLGSPDGVKLLTAIQALGGPVHATAPITSGKPPAEPKAPADSSDLAARLQQIENRLANDELERQAIMTMLSSVVSGLRRAGIC